MNPQLTATAVFLIPKIPQRHPVPEDKVYLCYDDNSPTPWDQKNLFVIHDEQKRLWFCHEIEVPMTSEALHGLANFIKDKHTPKSEEGLRRRAKNPLVIQAVVARSSSLDELRSMLNVVQLRKKLP